MKKLSLVLTTLCLLATPTAFANKSLTVAASYSNSSSSITSNVYSKITYSTRAFDTYSAYNSSGDFTCPVGGIYQVTANLRITSSYSSANAFTLLIYKNGSAVYQNGSEADAANSVDKWISISGLIPCGQGETIAIYAFSNATSPAVVAGTQDNFLHINRLAD